MLSRSGDCWRGREGSGGVWVRIREGWRVGFSVGSRAVFEGVRATNSESFSCGRSPGLQEMGKKDIKRPRVIGVGSTPPA